MKKFLPLLLCLLLSIFTLARATKPAHTPAPDTKMAQKKPTAQKADAKTLLNDANKALAAMIKAARADKELDPKTPKNKPFWKPAQLVAKNLKLAQTGLQTKSDDFFKGIAEASQAEQQMKVGWQLTDSKNTKVIENEKILGNAIESLRTNYSKEAARKKQGGELTAKEKAEFEKIKAQQKDLLTKISKLEKSAQKDKAVANGLSEIQKQAERITGQPATLDAYIATLYLLDRQIGLIRGYEYFVDKPLRADYVGLTDWIAGYDTWYYTCTTRFRTTGRGSIQVSTSTKTSPFLNQYPRRKSVRKNLTPKANPSICLTPRRNKSLPRKTLMNKWPPAMTIAWETLQTTKAKT